MIFRDFAYVLDEDRDIKKVSFKNDKNNYYIYFTYRNRTFKLRKHKRYTYIYLYASGNSILHKFPNGNSLNLYNVKTLINRSL